MEGLLIDDREDLVSPSANGGDFLDLFPNRTSLGRHPGKVRKIEEK